MKEDLLRCRWRTIPFEEPMAITTVERVVTLMYGASFLYLTLPVTGDSCPPDAIPKYQSRLGNKGDVETIATKEHDQGKWIHMNLNQSFVSMAHLGTLSGIAVAVAQAREMDNPPP